MMSYWQRLLDRLISMLRWKFKLGTSIVLGGGFAREVEIDAHIEDQIQNQLYSDKAAREVENILETEMESQF
jgi:hypothetical protein